MVRLVEAEFAATGHAQSGHETKTSLLDGCEELDASGSQLGHRGLDVVAHEIQLVSSAPALAACGMDAQLGRWEPEDQPPITCIDIGKPENVSKERPGLLGILGVDDRVRSCDHARQGRHVRHRAEQACAFAYSERSRVLAKVTEPVRQLAVWPAERKTDEVEQSVNVYKRESELIVASYSKTTAGLWVMNGWLRQLRQETDDEGLGAVIVSALDASESDIDVPVVDPNPDAPLLRMLGLRSYGVFMVGTQCVRVNRDAGAIQVTPKRNGGGQKGFTELADRTERLEKPTARQVGTAARDGLQKAL